MDLPQTPRERALLLDEQDSLKRFRLEFCVPTKTQIHSKSLAVSGESGQSGQNGQSIYLCGNSLGLQPRRTATRLQQYLATWASQGVLGHFKPLENSPLPTWLNADAKAASMMVPIVGCAVSEVAVMQTLTANLHLLLSAFYRPQADGRHKILLESKAFPSDHFAVESQIRHHGLTPETSMVTIESHQADNAVMTTNDIVSAIVEHASSTAVLLLPGIQYYSGQLLDIRTITSVAHQHGIFVIWDLAHAVGNVPLHLHDWDVDAAAWCSYKYLNSGPGSIGGMFVHSRHSQVDDNVSGDSRINRLAGWWGNNKSTRFAMDTKFRPVAGAAGFQLSNPSILDTTSLCASLEVFQEAGGVDVLRKKSVGLTRFLEDLLNGLSDDVKRNFRIITPSDPEQRGAQLSLLLADGLLEPVMDALLARAIIVDDRKPNVGMKTAMARRWMHLAIIACTIIVAFSLPADQKLLLDLDFGPSDSTWQKYVRSPPRRTVPPVSVLSQYTLGNVSNEGSLVNASTGLAILTRLAAEEDVPTIVLDFGQTIAGLLSISFAGSYSDGEGFPGLILAFSETLQYLTDRSDFTRSDNANGADKLTAGTDQIAVKNQPYTWIDHLGCENGTQVCADGLHGFRYVKVRLGALSADAPYTSDFGSVSISSISLEYSGYLGTPDTFTGHFECSDARITQWWYDAVYTNDLCTDIFSANDTEPRGAASPSLIGKLVLHDGAKRDRDPYVGDLAVAALTTYLSHNAPEAARNVLEDLALHQRDDGWIPPASINNYTLPLFDYPLWWVACSADYVMYTGNTTYLEAYYPNIVKVLDDYYVSHTNSETSLIERPDGAGDYAFISRTGPVTYYNALYVHALAKAALLADVLGELDDASKWRSRAEGVGPALINRNFDNSTGAFFDGGSCSDADICPTHAQDGNSLAILSGVVPAGVGSNSTMAESILSYLNQTTARPYGNAFYDNNLVGSDYADRVYAFISYFEIAARFKTSPDTAQGALEELRRLYGWMATNDPFLTFWEGIGANGTPYEGGFTSMAHGWSSGIVPLAINYILGVTPTAPGFQEWTLQPVFDAVDITWASGLVPTPDGGIWVQWQRHTNSLTLLVSSPETTRGTAILPLTIGASGSVIVDGHMVYSQDNGHSEYGASYQDGHVAVPLGGGRHIVIVR